MCNQGDMQSPVDLTHKRVRTTFVLGRLDRDYKPANTTLINKGHDMMVGKPAQKLNFHII
ncbi:putative carbonic anhydrase [Helianthus anomalus]